MKKEAFTLNQKANMQECILHLLKEENRNLRVICVKETTSTNDEVKKIALKGRKEPVLFIADRQTAGRGRKGRSFFSPGKTGIYMSLLLYPELSPELCTLITPMCAVAVCQAIEKVTGIRADIKWVNDIYLSGKKVAGILTEGAFSPKGAEYIIVGTGINLASPEEGFPDEIKNTAGALGCDPEEIRCRLIAEAVNCFTDMLAETESRSFIPLYRERLFFLGKEVTVISPEGSYSAVAADIDSACRLTVKKEDGEYVTLSSGEISLKL